MLGTVLPWRQSLRAVRQILRDRRTWVARPPGAAKTPWVPSDNDVEEAPLQAIRRAGRAGGLPQKAFSAPRLDKAGWRWTDVRGDKIFYRRVRDIRVPEQKLPS
ncbi:unnamed protein product [Effrenium voratum]|uniref:Uncharacterized protein n=1 Tax=Effrenium voratum TaxID=2562239 RepID=A0AA36HMX6_9DINO|nr:unnamed protein product [Effrenium voratum]CAJ1371766.1 unnamed protein product [Effrenium voratum]CAJ1421109.1 unnamed protein product [Effrenium voratum]